MDLLGSASLGSSSGIATDSILGAVLFLVVQLGSEVTVVNSNLVEAAFLTSVIEILLLRFGAVALVSHLDNGCLLAGNDTCGVIASSALAGNIGVAKTGSLAGTSRARTTRGKGVRVLTGEGVTVSSGFQLHSFSLSGEISSNQSSNKRLHRKFNKGVVFLLYEWLSIWNTYPF